MSSTHYDRLGVDRSAPIDEVRRAYLSLARLHHPDREGGDPAVMRALNEAWATLGDPARRAVYDLTLTGIPPIRSADRQPASGNDEDDLLADLADDTPLGGRVVLPRWVSLLPVAAFVASLALFFAGVLFGSTPAIGMSVAAFLVSCGLFLAAPFVALLESRRTSR